MRAWQAPRRPFVAAHPLLNPKTNPGMNPKAAAIGNPTDPAADGCGKTRRKVLKMFNTHYEQGQR
jgi:hypothetical protein